MSKRQKRAARSKAGKTAGRARQHREAKYIPQTWKAAAYQTGCADGRRAGLVEAVKRLTDLLDGPPNRLL